MIGDSAANKRAGFRTLWCLRECDSDALMIERAEGEEFRKSKGVGEAETCERRIPVFCITYLYGACTDSHGRCTEHGGFSA